MKPASNSSKPSLDDIRRLKSEITRIAELRGAHNIRIFGSVAKGVSTSTSDVDFLIDLDQDRSLLDLGALQYDLQALLGVDVDVLTEKAIHWYIRDQVLKEAVAL